MTDDLLPCHFPEGCTPADARHLREANHALAEEISRLNDLLEMAWDTIAEAGYEDHNHELKTAVLRLSKHCHASTEY